MKTYLFTARSKSRKRGPGKILATSIAAARAQLEAEGYDEIEFQTDDAATSQRGAGIGEASHEVDPATEIQARRINGVWASIWFALKGNAILLVPLLLWNGWSLSRGTPYGWGDWVGFGITVVLLFTITRALIPAILFQRLLEAQVWGRWEEMRGHLARIRRFSGALTPYMQDFYEAKTLIGIGRTEQAFQLHDRWRNHPDVPRALFVSMLSSLQDSARATSAKIDSLRELIELEPSSAQGWIDLALTYARHNIGRAEAEHAIVEAEQRELVPLYKAALAECRGILALDAGDPSQALQHLKAAAAGFLAGGGTPLIQALILDAQAFAAIALIRLGRKAEAEALWQRALPILRAHNVQEVLDRYHAAVAGKTWDAVP